MQNFLLIQVKIIIQNVTGANRISITFYNNILHIGFLKSFLRCVHIDTVTNFKYFNTNTYF